MNHYFLGIDIAKTNHVASLIEADGSVVIRAIKFKNSNEGYTKLLNTIQNKLNCTYNNISIVVNKWSDMICFGNVNA